MLTDAASYMVKAGQRLKPFYKNLIHVTFVAHAVNCLAEKVRDLFPEVNILINNGKKILLKAPSRVAVYKEVVADAPLPPVPILTRWGTWITATLFYADNWKNTFK